MHVLTNDTNKSPQPKEFALLPRDFFTANDLKQFGEAPFDKVIVCFVVKNERKLLQLRRRGKFVIQLPQQALVCK